MLTVQALIVYPIKATRGMVVPSAEVEARGLRHDRRWMLVRPDGAALTQRERPRLARIAAAPIAEGLRVAAPGMPPLDVPTPGPHAPRLTVTIWKDRVAGTLAGDHAHRWFSEYLGVEARLVHMPGQTVRPVDPRYAVGAAHVSFADGYPLLLTTTASLDDLNRRLDAPLPMRRFRPNVVVAGAEPYAEDRWRAIRVGAVGFHVVKPCARCVVTTTDPETGARGKEPLRTLATYRRKNDKVYFGQNLIPGGRGTIRVGDAVTVLAEGAPNV
ncbi:MOSC domain-containing protein [Rhodocaloribacter sp.]